MFLVFDIETLHLFSFQFSCPLRQAAHIHTYNISKITQFLLLIECDGIWFDCILYMNIYYVYMVHDFSYAYYVRVCVREWVFSSVRMGERQTKKKKYNEKEITRNGRAMSRWNCKQIEYIKQIFTRLTRWRRFYIEERKKKTWLTFACCSTQPTHLCKSEITHILFMRISSPKSFYWKLMA